MVLNFDLKNKTVVLTGSAGRVGSRFSEILSKAGANLILIDKDIEKNEKLFKKIKKQYKTNCLVSNIDITDASKIDNLVKVILKKYSKIDVLINNAHFVPRDDPIVMFLLKNIHTNYGKKLFLKILVVFLHVARNLEKLW